MPNFAQTLAAIDNMTDKFTVLDKLIESYPTETYYSEEKLRNLIQLLKREDSYNVFFDHCHNLGPNSGTCFNGNIEFPNTLVMRAKEVGSTQAFAEVESYLSSKKNNLECALLLYHINIDTEFQFSNGVRVIQTSSLNSTELAHFLFKEKISTGGLNTALLVIDFETKKRIYSSITSEGEEKKTDWSDLEKKTRLLQVLNDTRLILSLARHFNYGIPVVGSFEVVPDNLTLFNQGIGYSTYPEPRTGFGPPIIELEFRTAQKLLDQFMHLSETDQDKIRIALKRLNDAKIDSDWANKNINLRICLENLFCTGENGIARTISERAIAYTSFSKNRARNVYKFLSSAVHSGKPAEHDNITVREITEQIHKTILKYLEEGKYPEWPTELEKSEGKLRIWFRNLFKRN